MIVELERKETTFCLAETTVLFMMIMTIHNFMQGPVFPCDVLGVLENNVLLQRSQRMA